MATLTELTIDVTKLPTLEELQEFRVETMRVRVHGPAGGNPAITLRFQKRLDAERFLREWYDEDDEDHIAGLIEDDREALGLTN